MILLTVAALILCASFISVAVGIPSRHLGRAVRGRARLGVARLPREAQCAICPEDIETDGGTATLVFDKGSTYGITTCTYEENSGTEIICPYVTDTGELNGTVEYCPQTIALGDCVS
ncbi:hypothetical protein EDD22DRAFT_197994 [Suillus occidentalis]|nr:hypothetical protein EDD22DRAFT_197994 [Suillus occidentalis]